MSSTQSPLHFRFRLKYTAGAIAMIFAGVALHLQGCFAAVALYASTLSMTLAGGGIFLCGSLAGSLFLAASAVAWTYSLSKAIYNRTTQASVNQDKDETNDKVDANDKSNNNPKTPAKNIPNQNLQNNLPHTDKTKYNQKIITTSKHVEEIIKTLDNLLERAQSAHFEENGKLSAKDQPPRNRLQMLQWKEKNLLKILNTPQINERAALKRSIEQKADRKLSTRSKKGFRL